MRKLCELRGRSPDGDRFVPDDLRCLVLTVDENDDGVQGFELVGLEIPDRENDHLVSGMENSGRRAVETHLAAAALAGQGIGLPMLPVREIVDVQHLVGPDAGFLEEKLIDGYGTDIIELGLGHHGPMDLGYAGSDQHTLTIHQLLRGAIPRVRRASKSAAPPGGGAARASENRA